MSIPLPVARLVALDEVVSLAGPHDKTMSNFPSTPELDRSFDNWWANEGSGLVPVKSHDHEEHAHRIARIAWHNGAYAKHYYNEGSSNA